MKSPNRMPTFEEVKERMATAAAKIKPPTEEELKLWAEIEEACICSHCNSCVIIGPPCCEARAKEVNDAQSKLP